MTPDEIKTLSRIETIVEDMHGRLFGNDYNSGHIAKTEKRLDGLENKWSLAKGFFWAISAILTFLGFGGVIHIIKGGK